MIYEFCTMIVSDSQYTFFEVFSNFDEFDTSTDIFEISANIGRYFGDICKDLANFGIASKYSTFKIIYM